MSAILIFQINFIGTIEYLIQPDQRWEFRLTCWHTLPVKSFEETNCALIVLNVVRQLERPSFAYTLKFHLNLKKV